MEINIKTNSIKKMEKIANIGNDNIKILKISFLVTIKIFFILLN